MPKVKANKLAMNFEQQGNGEPLILIPYLAADNACYAFQVAEYSKNFTCISVDLRGTGTSGNPRGAYSTETLADDVAAFMQAIGVEKAHIGGLSLGAAVGMWLAAKHPERIKSLSLHSIWPKTDLFLATVVQSWQAVAKALASVPETTISAIFPWCFTPKLYAEKPDYIQSLSDFVRSRPPQSVHAFLEQTKAVLAHDASAQLGKIAAPTLLTFGRYDQITSMRFADGLMHAIRNSEIHVFEDCSHAPLYENVADFNEISMRFLKTHSGHAAIP